MTESFKQAPQLCHRCRNRRYCGRVLPPENGRFILKKYAPNNFIWICLECLREESQRPPRHLRQPHSPITQPRANKFGVGNPAPEAAKLSVWCNTILPLLPKLPPAALIEFERLLRPIARFHEALHKQRERREIAEERAKYFDDSDATSIDDNEETAD